PCLRMRKMFDRRRLHLTRSLPLLVPIALGGCNALADIEAPEPWNPDAALAAPDAALAADTAQDGRPVEPMGDALSMAIDVPETTQLDAPSSESEADHSSPADGASGTDDATGTPDANRDGSAVATDGASHTCPTGRGPLMVDVPIGGKHG